MDNGCVWHARTALPKDSDGGEALFENVVFWDNKDWHRWTPESNSFSSPPILLVSFHVLSSDWQAVSVAEVSFFDISGLETSNNLRLGVVTGVFKLWSWLDGETKDARWSNAFRYRERRYCSRYTTSNSNAAVSLINSVAGWSCRKHRN